jgi:hypothetical protein
VCAGNLEVGFGIGFTFGLEEGLSAKVRRCGELLSSETPMLQMLLLGAALTVAQPAQENQKLPGQLLPPELSPLIAAKVGGDKKEANGKDGKDDKEEKKEDDEKKPGDDPWRIFPNEHHGFKFTGHIYGTGVYNASNGSGTRYNGPMTTNDQEGVFLNQLWLTLSRPLKKP